MKSIGQELWLLSMATQCLEDLDNEELKKCYMTASTLNDKAKSSEICEPERRWAGRLYEDIYAEVHRRGLKLVELFVVMDYDGTFLRGREELKKFWMTLEFESMEEIADHMLKNCNDKQREAIIDLEREVVMLT